MTPAQASAAGKVARMGGKSEHSNPFPAGSANATAWARGWREINARFA